MAAVVQNPLERYEAENASAGLPWRLFSASIFIFFLSALTYLGLTFGYQPFLQTKIDEQDSILNLLAKRIAKSQEDQEGFINFYSQLINLKTIFTNHVAPSKVLALLEATTHPRVYFTGAAIKIPEKQLELDGIAESFPALSEQLAAWSGRSEVTDVLVAQAQRGEEGVRFRATLTLKKEVLIP